MIQSLKNPKKKSKKVSDYSSDEESTISEDSELFRDSVKDTSSYRDIHHIPEFYDISVHRFLMGSILVVSFIVPLPSYT